jgi:hypothetical protein
MADQETGKLTKVCVNLLASFVVAQVLHPWLTHLVVLTRKTFQLQHQHRQQALV